MSTPGHCVHCREGCLGNSDPVTKEATAYYPHTSNTPGREWHAGWADAECPMCDAACAERQRIVAWLGTLGLGSGPERWSGGLVYEQGQVVDWVVDAIARGDHLEDQ